MKKISPKAMKGKKPNPMLEIIIMGKPKKKTKK